MPTDRSTPFRLRAQLAAWQDRSAPVAPADIEALREEFEEACRAAVAAMPQDAGPLRLPKARLGAVLACERHALAVGGGGPPGGGDDPRRDHLVVGALVDRLVHHHVLQAGLDPEPTRPPALAVARGALEADGRVDELTWVDGLDGSERAALSARLERVVAALDDGWGAIDPAWWPRCEVPVSVPFADGRVLCSARFDVVLGGEPTGRPLVVIEVKSRGARGEHRAELFWYALLAAWSGCGVPVAVATWSAQDDALRPEPVSLGTLQSATVRAVDAVHRLGALAAGHPPRESGGSRCGWCPELDRCATGSDHLAGRARSVRAGLGIALGPGDGGGRGDGDAPRGDDVEYVPAADELDGDGFTGTGDPW